MPTAAAVQVMQGIEVPAANVDPRAFFRATRRLTFQQKGGSFAGLGQTDNVPVLQTGIISHLSVKATGNVVVTLGGGTCATTARWPYDLLKAARLSANGQSNLVNVSGAKLKARDLMARGDLNDRGVSQAIGGASPGTSRTQGTMSLAAESWGLGSNVSAVPAATYNFELNWPIPVAFDQVSLLGAIFAQTSATDLNLALDWATSADLFVLTGAATAVVTLTYVVIGTVYTIPQDGKGGVIVPDLSAFHSLIQTRFVALQNGDNEVRLSGQGVGRSLLRLYFQIFNGAPGVPLPVTAANYGQIGWRFGGNDTPEVWADGQHLRYFNERLFSSDFGAFHGFACLDFSSENALRDSVDEGTASELRLLANIAAGVVLASPVMEYVQETVFAGATGA
jgi:hypothetical protein